MVETDLQNMLMQAEEEFKYLEEQCLKDEKCDTHAMSHAIAMITLYNFALNLKLSGAQLGGAAYRTALYHR